MKHPSVESSSFWCGVEIAMYGICTYIYEQNVVHVFTVK